MKNNKNFIIHMQYSRQTKILLLIAVYFEGIILYKNNIWVLSNAIETSDKKEHDRISYLPGVTFKKVE